MNNKYIQEIEEFNVAFHNMKSKRIVIYGIGRMTSTLLEGVHDFNFVGLMDKSKDNIGKNMWNLPILDLETAEKEADLIVINTHETYWNVIYSRISCSKIPVYYRNGHLAQMEQETNHINPFFNLSVQELKGKIEQSDVISFDFFDTLFQRKLCNLNDVFEIVALEIGEEWTYKQPFLSLRINIRNSMDENYSLDDIYHKMEIELKQPRGKFDKYKEIEIKVESNILEPRKEILKMLEYAIELHKEVFIISDMYLPINFYVDMLKKYQMGVQRKNILVSCELKISKEKGNIWKYFKEQIVSGKRALHIGDSLSDDVEKPLVYGIDTYLVPSAWELMKCSSLKRIIPEICQLYESTTLGIVNMYLFGNPYVFAEKQAQIQIDDNYSLGYVLFGPVVMTYLLWLRENLVRKHKDKVLFLARDGYFLKQDFEYLSEILGEKYCIDYIGISRQLAMLASIENDMDLLEYMKMPYSGSIKELFEDRLGIQNIDEDLTIEECLKKNQVEIWEYIYKIKKCYLSYLEPKNITNEWIVCDLSYYGNNQRYLNKLLKLSMPGYYFVANLTPQNINTSLQEMHACFQKEDDLDGSRCNVERYEIVIESFLTAPYGMVKYIDKDGKMVCAEKKSNQLFFCNKEEMNEGVKKFIADYIEIYGNILDKIAIRPIGIDQYYGLCMNRGMQLSDTVKASFYNDNRMMHRMESLIFE